MSSSSKHRAAKEVVKPAFDREDYATCYQVFDEAFTFTPITGAEWRELKATGEDYATCYKVFDEAFTFTPITGAEWRALKAAGNN